MSNAYDEGLRALAYETAQTLGYQSFVHAEGTYAHVAGPSYETGAECLFLRNIGGDSVGMSTAPEVVAAKHVGLKILGYF
jgi:purine-nucleoside phosphorylase